MSIEALSTMVDGTPWGPEGRAAFASLGSQMLGRFECTSAGQARPAWPGPLDWVCTFSPFSEPANLGPLDVAVDASGAAVLWSPPLTAKSDFHFEVEDGTTAANLTFAGGDALIAMVEGTRNGHKGRSRFHPVSGVTDSLGLTPRDTAGLRYTVNIPAGARIFDNPGQDMKMPGLGGLRDSQTDGFYSPSGGVMRTDAWTARIQARYPRASWYGQTPPVGQPFLETYLYVEHANGWHFTDQARPNAEGATDYGIITVLKNQTTGAFLPLLVGDNTIEWRIVRNTPGVDDGIIRCWLNGVLGVELTDVRLTTTDDVPVNQLVAEWFYNDNIPTGDGHTLTLKDMRLLA